MSQEFRMRKVVSFSKIAPATLRCWQGAISLLTEAP